MGGGGTADRETVEEGDDRGRTPGEAAEHLAAAVLDRQRADEAAAGEMLHQPQEEGQIVGVHPLLVEGEDVGTLRRVQQVVRILDALGDAFGGKQLADAVARHEGGHLIIGHFGIDGQDRALLFWNYSAAVGAASSRSSRGSGKKTFSSAVETVSTRTS